jgi:hypothetical protein
MCDPITIATVATVVSAASTAAAGYSAYQGAKVAEGQAKTNQVYEQRALDDARERGSKAEIAHYRQMSALKGEQIARFSGAGLDVAFGSPAEVITDTAVLGNQDADVIRKNFQNEVDGHRISIANLESEAENARFQQAMIPATTALDMGSTLLTGYGKVKSLMGPATPTPDKSSFGSYKNSRSPTYSAKNRAG